MVETHALVRTSSAPGWEPVGSGAQMFRADYRYSFGRTDLIAFIDIINLLAAENPSYPEFNERTGKSEVEEGEAFPLLGLRFEW